VLVKEEEVWKGGTILGVAEGIADVEMEFP